MRGERGAGAARRARRWCGAASEALVRRGRPTFREIGIGPRGLEKMVDR